MDGHESYEELNTEHLEDNDNGPNNDESWVGVDSLEDVKLVIDFSEQIMLKICMKTNRLKMMVR